ncbi:MAG TPA: sulfite exporter TauE/SafE family protein [Labilithrix sp.]|nr:sulfite exporter TauE/SafE family protein [Labilithrix sp.]
MILAFLAAVVLLAFLVEAAAGFGGTVVTIALASQLLPVDDVLARFLPVNLLLWAYVATRHRRHVAVRLLVGRILPLMGLGAAAGFALARVTNPGWLKIVFAVFVIVLSVVELRSVARGRARRGPLSAPIAVAALVGAGVLHGLFACGGPLAVWVMGRDVEDKGAFRATLSALWLVLNLFLVTAYALDAKIHVGTLRESALLLVPLAVGIAAGEWIHARLSPVRFRVTVFVLLLVAAVVLLIRSLLGA